MYDDEQVCRAFDRLYRWLLGLLIVVVAFSAAGMMLLGCASTNPRTPRPPRGRYSLEQAQEWVRRNQTPAMLNHRYYQIRPR